MPKLPNWGLATRIAALTLVALIAVTVVNFTITFSGPPPMRRPVALADLVPVLSGAAQVPRGYPWVTGPVASPTFRPADGERPLPRTAQRLARTLDVPEASVRVTASSGRRSGELRDPTSELFDGFTLGVRQPEGTWRIVRAARSPTMTRWHWVTLASTLLAALVFSALASIVARGVVRPLDRLGREASLAGLGREHRITRGGPPEVARVAASVAAMRDRVADALEHRTALFTAVAHDMAAPIARLRFRLAQLPEAEREAAEADVAELSEMIAGIVEFAALDRRPPQLKRLDAVRIAQDLAEREDIPFASDVDHSYVLGDSTSLARLLTNLVVNARRYGGGCELVATTSGARFVLKVLDRGPGISPDLVDRIFEPFFRAEPSRSRDTAGAGLGLAIARSIAESHGGTLEYSARIDGGAIFALTLPILPPDKSGCSSASS